MLKILQRLYKNMEENKMNKISTPKTDEEDFDLMELQENYDTLAVENMLEVNKLCNEIDRLREQNAKLRELAERAIGYLRNSYRDSFKDEENELRAELDQLKEGAK